MRTGEVFVVGAIIGAAVGWLWGREMEEYAGAKMRPVRTKAEEGVRAVEETARKVLDRGREVLRGVDAFVRDTKADVRGARGGAGSDSGTSSERSTAAKEA